MSRQGDKVSMSNDNMHMMSRDDDAKNPLDKVYSTIPSHGRLALATPYGGFLMVHIDN